MSSPTSWLIIATVLAHVHAGKGRRTEDEITMLPGWSGDLPSRMYSGYIDATPKDEPANTLHMKYTFWESEGNPAKDPLLVWSNGGPGAGSEFGAFTELGPMLLWDESLKTADYNATGVPSLFANPQAWTKVASLLIYDAPPPVGFSYCHNDPGGDGYSCGDWDDYRTARSVHTFLENWFIAFPDFAKHDLYLSGESYAGVYIPMLAREILEDDTSATKTHLKGMLIGDGCAGTDVLCGDQPGHAGPWYHLQFFHGHGQVSDKLHDAIVGTCGVAQLQAGVTDPACSKLISQMNEAIGGYFEYALYDECGPDTYINAVSPVALKRSNYTHQQHRQYWSAMPPLKTNGRQVGGALNDYPCGGVGAMLKWLNHSAVKQALHVPATANFFLTDNGVGFNYNLTEKDLMPFYRKVVEEQSMRVLVYNGDTDPGINSFASQNWTVALGFEETQAWRPWTVDGQQQMGGYVTRYAGGFDFLTIRGAGHMVPEFKPKASLEFLTRFLNNEDYQPYMAPASRSTKREL
mmetsp:Transcript_21512/g.54995  ORF Transcript_21512/g.54995 Transcript_21512/m.54995 type:complete len:520 (+) Transcript_21512:54-1613(+)